MTMVHVRHPCGHRIAVARNGRTNARVRRHNRRLLARQGLEVPKVVTLREWSHVSEWWDGWEEDMKLLEAVA